MSTETPKWIRDAVGEMFNAGLLPYNPTAQTMAEEILARNAPPAPSETTDAREMSGVAQKTNISPI